MSKHHRHSRVADNSAHTTEPAEQLAQEPTPANTPEEIQAAFPELTTATAEPANEPSAKAMAAAEERNAARAKALKDREDAVARAAMEEPVSIIGLAAKGREALLNGLRQHNEKTAKAKQVEYIPPPRSARQMETLAAEIAAGQRAKAKVAEQQAHRPTPKRDPNEGLTTPVHRPRDFVPGLFSKDPAITR